METGEFAQAHSVGSMARMGRGVPWRGVVDHVLKLECVVDHVLKLSLGRFLAFSPVPPWPSMRCHGAKRASRLSRQVSAGREGVEIETLRPPFRWFMTSHSYSGDRRARRVFLLCALLLTTGSWAPARSTAGTEAPVIRVESRSRRPPPPPCPRVQSCAAARSAALRLGCASRHDARSAKRRRATTSAMAVVAAGFSIPAAQYESYAR